MIDYMKPIYGKHPSKRMMFKGECGGCGKPLRRSAKNKIGYICRKCGPRSCRTCDNSSACYDCPFELDCTARVQLGLWVRCETPDIADLERLNYAGGLNDDKVRAEVHKALEQRGERKILETAVSQSAQKIYQSYINGEQREMPIGIRTNS
jgi:hypothetical protein